MLLRRSAYNYLPCSTTSCLLTILIDDVMCNRLIGLSQGKMYVAPAVNQTYAYPTCMSRLKPNGRRVNAEGCDITRDRTRLPASWSQLVLRSQMVKQRPSGRTQPGPTYSVYANLAK